MPLFPFIPNSIESDNVIPDQLLLFDSQVISMQITYQSFIFIFLNTNQLIQFPMKLFVNIIPHKLLFKLDCLPYRCFFWFPMDFNLNNLSMIPIGNHFIEMFPLIPNWIEIECIPDKFSIWSPNRNVLEYHFTSIVLFQTNWIPFDKMIHLIPKWFQFEHFINDFLIHILNSDSNPIPCNWKHCFLWFSIELKEIMSFQINSSPNWWTPSIASYSM